MCGVPIFILTCKPFQNTKLLSGALPDPRRFPPATCWADRGGGWLRIFWESERGMVSHWDIPHPCVSPGEILEGAGVPSGESTARTSAELLFPNFC